MSRAGWLSSKTLLTLLFALSGCTKPVPPANPHYVLGGAWVAKGVWYYPAQSFDLNDTGLASIYEPNHPPLTTNGEAFDPTALAAAHQTLQLPAIVRLTNLETGLQMLVRINDRGPPNPARMLAVTPRVAVLLEFPPTGVARVRLEVLQTESREAAEAVTGGSAAKLDVATAPRSLVRQEALLPPTGGRNGGRIVGPPPMTTGPEADAATIAVSPTAQRLVANVTRIAPAPGMLWLSLGSFSRPEFARMQLARISGLGARVESIRNGRTIDYRVTMGPYNRVSDADTALERVIAAGVNGGRIIIE